MTFIKRNAFVSSTTLAGVPVYRNRRVQIDDMETDQDPGLVEIMADSSSAMAPLLQLILIDDTRATYTRGDVVTIQRGIGFRAAPNANPYHILRVKQNYAPFPDIEVWLARLDIQTQRAIWWQRITADMAGATRTAAWEPTRSQIVATSDGTFGVGLSLVQNGVTRMGYLAPVSVTIGVNEYAVLSEVTPEGLNTYEHPVLLFEAPLALAKGDVLQLADGRRVVIADIAHKLQRMGVVLATLALSEAREPGDLVYSLPTT